MAQIEQVVEFKTQTLTTSFTGSMIMKSADKSLKFNSKQTDDKILILITGNESMESIYVPLIEIPGIIMKLLSLALLNKGED
jgi:hypothetical protein